MAKQVTIQNDIGHKQTDDKISELEKKIKKEYEQAAKEAEKKWKDYLKAFERKDKVKQQQLKAGLISKSEYDKWRTGQIMIGKRWEEMRRTLATDLANSSEICRSMTEGYMPEVYALNHDYATFLIEADSLVDTSYTLYDRQAVERLIRDNPQLLPDMSDKTAEKIRKGELIKWNEQQLTSSVTQGILQGESIPHLAKRLRGVAQMDYNASIRNARTMMGNAESAGRIDSMKRAEGMGIKMQKRWLSTLDNRTRHEHRLLMGQTQPVDEPFVVGQYKIMYPCDSRADPAMVYNCRCAMTSVFAGYDKQITDYDIDERLGGMTYEEWRHAKEKPAPKKTPMLSVVNGKDISKTWTRRADQFDFEIEDVINAQGFDGLPRVVSAEEFNKAVKESNFIAQRTYSAPDQEILDAYRNQLYNGKWYVDCSVGESHYGQGMYCTANEGKTINDSIKNTMDKYIEINLDRITDYGDLQIDVKSAVETFTVTPDAKFINYDDLRKLKENEITELSSSGNYDKMNEIFNMDNGSYATIKGYDGITGVYNFVSKDNDDAIILNRTKVIFKGE